MDEFKIDIQDRQGRIITLRINPDRALQDVVELAADTLALPRYNPHGTPLSYALYNPYDGEILRLGFSPQALNLQHGQRLEILPYLEGHHFDLKLTTIPNPGMLYPVAQRETTLGRDFSNDIVIRHKSISRQHGVFEWNHGFHFYMDLGSANGSWINHQPITRRMPISIGDVLMLGQEIQLTYQARFTDAPPPTNTDADAVIHSMNTPETRTNLNAIPRAQLYISYEPDLADLADMLHDGLQHANIQAWTDPNDAAQAMRRSELMLVILSRSALQNPLLTDHWQQFRQMRKPIIPILIEACPIPEVMEDAPYVLEYHMRDDALLEDILTMLSDVLK